MTVQTNRATIAFTALFGLALTASLSPSPAAAQWSGKQRAACGADAQRLCGPSMGNPQQLNACMSRNASQVSAGCKAAMGWGGKKKTKKSG